MGVIDARIEALAASQYGVFATWQLRLVIRRSRLDRAARDCDRRLRRLYRAMYATGPYVPATTVGSWRAILAYGPTLLLSHRAAARFTTWSRGRVGRSTSQLLAAHAQPRLASTHRSACPAGHRPHPDRPHPRHLPRPHPPRPGGYPHRRRAPAAPTRTPRRARSSIPTRSPSLLARSNGHRGSRPPHCPARLRPHRSGRGDLRARAPVPRPPCASTASRCRSPTSSSTTISSTPTGRTQTSSSSSTVRVPPTTAQTFEADRRKWPSLRRDGTRRSCSPIGSSTGNRPGWWQPQPRSCARRRAASASRSL